MQSRTSQSTAASGAVCPSGSGTGTPSTIPGKVPSVEYGLSPLGESLLEHIAQLMRWCLHHGDRMSQAQQAYDARLVPADENPLEAD